MCTVSSFHYKFHENSFNLICYSLNVRKGYCIGVVFLLFNMSVMCFCIYSVYYVVLYWHVCIHLRLVFPTLFFFLVSCSLCRVSVCLCMLASLSLTITWLDDDVSACVGTCLCVLVSCRLKTSNVHLLSS